MSETRNDAVQIVREALNAQLNPVWNPGSNRAARDALDRIEAVVNAARDVRYDVMNEGFLSQETSDQVHAALEAFDSLTQETPAQEERT